MLITYSFVKILTKRFPEVRFEIVFRETNLDNYQKDEICAIFSPGFYVGKEAYPIIFSLYSNLENLPLFFPISCVYGGIDHKQTLYSTQEKTILNKLKRDVEKFWCRDVAIVEMLLRNGIEAEFSGDMALYDEDYLNTEFYPPCIIKSIAFTIGHHYEFYSQAIEVLKYIKERFEEAELFVCYHSKVAKVAKTIGDYAESLGYSKVVLHGDVRKMEQFYSRIDLHVGYRLHGHIAALRKRKPSILLAEDVRSLGFMQTECINVGCFECKIKNDIDEQIVSKISDFVEYQLSNNFYQYDKCFKFIDKTYNNVVVRVIEDMIAKIKQNASNVN